MYSQEKLLERVERQVPHTTPNPPILLLLSLVLSLMTHERYTIGDPICEINFILYI